MNLVDVVLEKVLAVLDIEPNETKKAQFRAQIEPLVEEKIISVVIETLTDEEKELFDKEVLSESEYIELVMSMANNENKQKAMAMAMERLVRDLTKQPN